MLPYYSSRPRLTTPRRDDVTKVTKQVKKRKRKKNGHENRRREEAFESGERARGMVFETLKIPVVNGHVVQVRKATARAAPRAGREQRAHRPRGAVCTECCAAAPRRGIQPCRPLACAARRRASTPLARALTPAWVCLCAVPGPLRGAVVGEPEVQPGPGQGLVGDDFRRQRHDQRQDRGVRIQVLASGADPPPPSLAHTWRLHLLTAMAGHLEQPAAADRRAARNHAAPVAVGVVPRGGAVGSRAKTRVHATPHAVSTASARGAVRGVFATSLDGRVGCD